MHSSINMFYITIKNIDSIFDSVGIYCASHQIPQLEVAARLSILYNIPGP